MSQATHLIVTSTGLKHSEHESEEAAQTKTTTLNKVAATMKLEATYAVVSIKEHNAAKV